MTSNKRQSSLVPRIGVGRVVIFGGVYPALILILPMPCVNHLVATAVYAGIALGQTANLEPSFIGFGDAVECAWGAVKRRFPTGGSA